MRKKYTDELLDKAVELYVEGKTYAEITNATGLPKGTISNLPKRYNLSRRNNRATGDTHKECPRCHKRLENTANFCWYCGNDVRSESQLLLTKCEKIMQTILLAPEAARSEASAYMREIMNYLKKEG